MRLCSYRSTSALTCELPDWNLHTWTLCVRAYAFGNGTSLSCVLVFVSPHCQSVCLHTCWAVLNWLGPVSMSKQPGEDWGSQMRWLGATEDIITPCVSLAKTGAPKQSFIKVDPHLRWGGGYQLTCCPAVRSGIKLQVERESIQRIEWGGNKKTCRYLQGSRLRHSDCGRSSCLTSSPHMLCNSAGNLAVLLRVSL